MQSYLRWQTRNKYSLKMQLSKGRGGRVARALTEQFGDSLRISNRNKRKVQFAIEIFLFNAWLAVEVNKHHPAIEVVVSYSRDKDLYSAISKKYFSSTSYNAIIKIIDIAEEYGYITGQHGYRIEGDSRRSYYQPTPKLVNFLAQYSGHTVLHPVEVVQLKDTNKHLINYPETSTTLSYRSNIQVINQNISSNSITLPYSIVTLYPYMYSSSICICRALVTIYSSLEEDQCNCSTNSPQTPLSVNNSCQYKRVFNERFDNGGRFYCDIQNLPKQHRAYLQFNGEPTTSYDYSGLHIRMLYHLKGIDYQEDPYRIDGFGRDAEVKPAVNTILNAASETAAIRALANPKNRGNTKRVYVPYQRAKRLLEAFKAHHGLVAEHIASGVGTMLQYEDSRLAEQIMCHFARKGVVCLGIHDGFIVSESNGVELEQVMRESYNQEYGFYPVIKKEY